MALTPIPTSKCTSRPDCPCEFCVCRRSRLSPGEVQDNLAEDFLKKYGESIETFTQRRDRELDADTAGRLPYPCPEEFLLGRG